MTFTKNTIKTLKMFCLGIYVMVLLFALMMFLRLGFTASLKTQWFHQKIQIATRFSSHTSLEVPSRWHKCLFKATSILRSKGSQGTRQQLG